MIQAVRSALSLKLGNQFKDWSAFAEAVDQHYELRLPCSIADLRVIYERLPVRADACNPERKGNVLVDFLLDVPGVCLVYDTVLSGAKAPQLAIGGDFDSSLAIHWTKYMSKFNQSLIFSKTDKFAILVAPLQVFNQNRETAL